MVINKNTRQVLMLEHKSLRKLLPPGGHIDEGETPLQAAYRELEEETGIKPDIVKYRALCSLPLVPFDIDTHFIPENPQKGEMPHYHHDFRYIFLVDNIDEILIDSTESNGFKWIDWDDFIKQENFRKMALKVEEII